MLRVIDNKRIDLTNSEFEDYQRICKSYDRQNFKGEDLFKGLFETNEKGIIVYLKAPQAHISMEVYLFIVNLFLHQHLGLAASEIHEMHQAQKQATYEAQELLKQMKERDQKSQELLALAQQLSSK